MTTYRLRETKTISRHQQDFQMACMIEYKQCADLVIAIIGLEKYWEWVDAFIPDDGPWSECLKLVREFYNSLVDAKEHRDDMKEGRPQ